MEDLKDSSLINSIDIDFMDSVILYETEYTNIMNKKKSKHYCKHIHQPHAFNVDTIIYLFLKSFLNAKYIIIKNNVLIAEYILYEKYHILYINNDGFGLTGPEFNGFVHYAKDFVICATIINLIHAYYNEIKNNQSVNYVIENFPKKLIKGTVLMLYKNGFIQDEIFIKNNDDYVILCLSINLEIHSYTYSHNNRQKLAEIFLSLLYCEWIKHLNKNDYTKYSTTMNIMVDNELSKNKITYDENELEYIDHTYPSFFRDVFENYFNVLVGL
jgi:ribosomal protein S8